MPLAEECGLIRQVGEWTLERALSQIGAWQQTLPGKPWFALNVSAAELAQGDVYFERLRSALRENKVEGSRIELEVTERVLMSHLAGTSRRCGASAASACASRSTTSAPATRASPTCACCRWTS